MTQNFRLETDSYVEIKVPAESYYSAQTQRSIQNFPISTNNAGHKMPKEVIYAMLLIKKACALANKDLMAVDPKSDEFKKFSPDLADKIVEAVDEILNKFEWFYENHFPLVVWQTGSGTQTNMNVNEVIASVANEKATGKKGGKSPVHPNDHVNLGQSSNDTFPTAMNVATVLITYQKLLPTLIRFANELAKKENEFENIIKIGRKFFKFIRFWINGHQVFIRQSTSFFNQQHCVNNFFGHFMSSVVGADWKILNASLCLR